uniref:Uncharacterized protein n=1 Tax=Knipowitschia caucasica TaxID=637954 RepID=A0AAV2LKF5_KNICA
MQTQVQRMESHSRQLELKIRNHNEQIGRLEERELELKKEYNALHQRHTEMIHNYMEHVERIKLQQVSDASESSAVSRVRRERPQSCIFPSSAATSLILPEAKARAETPATEGWRFTDPAHDHSNASLKLDFTELPKDREGKAAQDPAASWGSSLADDCKEELSNVSGSQSTSTPSKDPGTGSRAVGATDRDQSSDVQDIIESTPELDMDLIGTRPCSTPTEGIENKAFDRNTESLFEELSSAGTGLIGDVDDGADLLGKAHTHQEDYVELPIMITRFYRWLLGMHRYNTGVRVGTRSLTGRKRQ